MTADAQAVPAGDGLEESGDELPAAVVVLSAAHLPSVQHYAAVDAEHAQEVGIAGQFVADELLKIADADTDWASPLDVVQIAHSALY